MNKGTRSKDNPMGDGTLKRERVGNEIMKRTIHLCRLLHKHGSFFTLENPKTSYAWKTSHMSQLLSDCDCAIAQLDQCMYGLRIPDSDNKLGLAFKPTIFAGILPSLDRLARNCSHQHKRVAVVGGVRRNGKWCKRSQLAGAYPRRLCTSYAKIFEGLFA